MKTANITLFESAQANFRLSLQTMYEKTKIDGSVQNKVFYNPQNDSLTANVGTFLCFYYYLPEDFRATQAVYTSTAHIYYIRQIFEEMHSYLNAPDLLMNADGTKIINPKYANALTISDIGKKLDWISLRVYLDENGTLCVGITTSKSNGYTSNLIIKEFLSIYDIIMHLDFASIEYQSIILDMISKMSKTNYPRANYAPQNNNYVNNYNNRRTTSQYQQPAQFGQGRSFPSYAQPQVPNYQTRPTPNTQAAPGMYQPQFQQKQSNSGVVLPPRAVEKSGSNVPPTQVSGLSEPNENTSETRSGKKIFNLNDVENIPIEDESLSTADISEEEALNDIFQD